MGLYYGIAIGQYVMTGSFYSTFNLWCCFLVLFLICDLYGCTCIVSCTSWLPRPLPEGFRHGNTVLGIRRSPTLVLVGLRMERRRPVRMWLSPKPRPAYGTNRQQGGQGTFQWRIWIIRGQHLHDCVFVAIQFDVLMTKMTPGACGSLSTTV